MEMGLQELAKRIGVLRPALGKVYHAAYDEVTREEAEALLALFRELAPFLESRGLEASLALAEEELREGRVFDPSPVDEGVSQGAAVELKRALQALLWEGKELPEPLQEALLSAIEGPTGPELIAALEEGQRRLREAKARESRGTVTAVSHAYIAFDVDYDKKFINIATGNNEFHGWSDQVREGSTPDGWRVRWERRDVGATTGEGFLPRHIWGWLCDATDKVKEE
ncbi:hypothetical protein [Thermus sp. 93170]|uniref:hypothetical protein n=1 Tax=Thermus sp. 93170 TaxID=1046939 RepID=UPI003F43E4F3